MNNSLDDFFDWNKVLHLMKIFQESIEKIFDEKEDWLKYKEYANSLVKDFKKELENISTLRHSNWNIKLIGKLKK